MLSISEVPERILEKIERPEFLEGHWIWTGGQQNGYSATNLGSRVDGTHRSVKVHRLMYEAYRGAIPPGLELDHLCRTPLCCNPWHLEPVTHRVNTLRSTSPSAVHAKKTCCPKCGGAYTQYNRSRHGRRIKMRVCGPCRNAREKRKRQERLNGSAA